MNKALFIMLAALPVSAFAIVNPEVVPPECTPDVVESCGGVTPPSGGPVVSSADCTNFVFDLENVIPGSERVNRREYWSGGESCPEPKDLPPVYRSLPARISWTASADGVSRDGAGRRAAIDRPAGVCRATCTFELSVDPTVCDAPSPVRIAGEAVFTDEVTVSERSRPRLCCVSPGHAPHGFDINACDCPGFAVDPSAAASVVSVSCTNAVVLGLAAGASAHAVATAPCGSGSCPFDVVGIGDLTASGLCKCFSASDATDVDGDAPTVETMDLGPGLTGFSLSLPVAPARWATDARWRAVSGPGGAARWMPDAGNFAVGGQETLVDLSSVDGDAGPVTLDAWFDCEYDLFRASDEPRRRVIGRIARLGTLEALADAGRRAGETNACDEAFSPGERVRLTNRGFLPLDRVHTLKVIRTLPREKSAPMNISDADLAEKGLNEWELRIPDDCSEGLFWVALADPLHSCTTLVKRLQVQGCRCTSCEEFAKDVEENGCIDVTFGLGRTASGGAKAPARFVLDRTAALPDLVSETAPDGRMDVSVSNGVMTVAFFRTGGAVPVAVFALTPGADAFTLRETRDGSLRKTVRWTLADGVWTMETTDETVAPAQLVRRETRRSGRTARGAVETLVAGGVTVETETEEIPDFGPVPVRETRGSGPVALTTYRSYVASGPAVGRVRSEVCPDGGWTLYGYDATGRVASVVTPFGDAAPVLDGERAVTGYGGSVRKTVYGYAPVDARDDGSVLPDEPRAVVESVGSDALGWTEVSRRYTAHFVSDGERVEVSERASAPGAAYGAEGSQRTVSSYLWNRRGAGRPVRRETPDGLVATWAYDFTPSNVVVEARTVPATATNGIPFKTTVERTVEDLRGDVLREETYVVTGSGRELLSWTDFERDAAGHELRRESSDGSLVERAWSCCGPEWEMDERGIATVYSYDALGRQATMTRSGVTTLWNYDLSGNATNVTRAAGALAASSSSGYDSLGRLAWSVGEDGVRTEYRYGVSPEGGETRTTIRAAGTDCAVTNTTVSFRDGTVKATYLNGVLKTTETREPFAETVYEGSRGVSSPRWTRTESDFLGRTVSESRPGYGGSTLVTSNAYDVAGRIIATRSYSIGSGSSPLAFASYGYDVLGENSITVSDRNFNGVTDWTGPDLIQSNAVRYVKLDNAWWRESRRWSVHRDGSAEPQLVATSRTRVTGLGVASARGTLADESVSIDLRGNATTNRIFRNRAAAEEIAWTRYPTSSTPAVAVSTNGLVRSSTSQTGVTTTYGYDALERETSVTDGRGNTTRTVYDVQGRVSSIIDALGYSTAYGYDALGRQTSVTDPLTNTVTTAYDAEGHVVSQRGATYPVDYAYDEFGDKISMTTYRNAGGPGFVPAAGDTTRWLRDEATGLVTNKVYADGKGPCYTYTPEGKLAMRIWARGIVTTYSYDANGALTNTVYSDGTPTISLAYNRAGRQIEAHDAAGVTTFLYDDFGGVINETVIGVAGTNTIERFYDDFGRSLGYSLNSVRQSTLAYDPATGRLASMEVPVSDGSSNNSPTPTPNSNFFTWNYLSGSDLKSSLAYPNGLTASWQYDANNQLLQVCNATPTNTISQYDYVYDAAGRRINVSKSGTAFNHDDTIAYGYNEKSELTNAVAAVDAAYRYSYDFDEIGNRESSSERGTNSVYAANSLNQYTAVDDFAPQFDDDGNQTLIKTETGIWSVTYNGENRPILWENVSTNSSALNSSTPPLISMSYDRMGRRVTKNAQRFVYDGYLQIANFELVSANSQIPTQNSQLFVWDPTEPIATRPLVWNRASTVSYYAYDGNKNVSQIVSYDDVVLTRYEYSPFGLLTLTSGFCAYDNAWRYSSECADDDIGVVYFNYRFYDYSGGRWTCRDFIYETGGANIYEFCNNDALLYFDSKGEHPALILFLIGILAYPQIANAPTNEFEANNGYSSAGPLNLIVDYSAAKVLSIGVRCCGILMGYLRFKYWETVAILRVANVAKNSSRKVSAVGAAFDPVEGKIAVEMSGGRLIEKPTPIMEAIAEEIGGYGNKNACKNTIGACVEFKGADTLLKQNSVIGNIRFVPVIRPRTMGVLPPCENCLKMLENFDVGPVNPEWNLNMYWIPGSWLLDLDWDLP